MPITEVTADVWLEQRKHSAVIHVAHCDPFTFSYADTSAIARAVALVKESKQYAAYLKREGLA